VDLSVSVVKLPYERIHHRGTENSLGHRVGLKKLALVATAFALALLFSTAPPATRSTRAAEATVYNVKSYGATGDGKHLDTQAINKAIDAAAAAGGGTVYFPAGNYLSVSIHLKSNIGLYLDQGAKIIAADTTNDAKYDSPEPNQWDAYQDFGHTHWHNSLIWGENLTNVSIAGPGMIWGKGLVRAGNQSRTQQQNDALNANRANEPKTPFGYPNPRDAVEPGWGNKSIALKNCRNVLIRDITILHGGHFAILATGVDNLTIDNIKIDTNRDGIDVDACKNVRISNCTVNSPFDDGICPKSSFALGYARATENVTITNCQVSGYDEGTLLDGTFKRDYRAANGTFSPTGRIKFGTESNGGFKNITIDNCVFDYCRGLALESVDGALLEDVAISNITMRDISNCPIFLRLGSRMRGPSGPPVGELRRVKISNIVVYNAEPRYASLISGIPGHDIQDVTLDNIRIYYRGGGTKAQAALQPPEKEGDYPEPTMFGEIPAYGFFIRHVNGLEMNGVSVSYLKDEPRAPFILADAKSVELRNIKAPHGPDIPSFILKNVEDFSLQQSWPLTDMRLKKVTSQQF
jgi:polygalacturonase